MNTVLVIQTISYDKLLVLQGISIYDKSLVPDTLTAIWSDKSALWMRFADRSTAAHITKLLPNSHWRIIPLEEALQQQSEDINKPKNT